MERQNSHIRVVVGHEVIRVPWESRQLMLEELRVAGGTDAIVQAFVDVGVSQPVELPHDDVIKLYGLLDRWADRLGFEQLPEGIWGLRCAIADEIARRAKA